MDVKYVFECINPDSKVVHVFSEDRTWWELTDEFIYFLQGCGYQVTRDEVADYLNEGRESDGVFADCFSSQCMNDTIPNYDNVTVAGVEDGIFIYDFNETEK